LHNCKNIKACGENSENQFAVKLVPGQEKLIKMKITNEGNG
jgi:ArsR family metal-binding transcriptional regulator